MFNSVYVVPVRNYRIRQLAFKERYYIIDALYFFLFFTIHCK